MEKNKPQKEPRKQAKTGGKSHPSAYQQERANTPVKRKNR